MNLVHYYWCFQKVVPERICDDIVKYALSMKDETGIIGQNVDKKKLDSAQIKNLKKQRDSNIVWLSDRWVLNEIQPFVSQANVSAGWNFQWDWTEACQFTKYSKGQYYGWHSDSWSQVYDNPGHPVHGKRRKLSATLSLSNEKSYKGGDLEFDFRNVEREKQKTRICKEIKPKGSVVVFPSDIWHRVTPVTQGCRYSLVVWNLGWPFR